ncbi:hypothetical protein C8Q80DRAFT_1273848 [Daedaleopsis nitida]|nr:hypothetical protein C8Q80DRAFT_1273848 [Daedaleopsis nitida]
MTNGRAASIRELKKELHWVSEWDSIWSRNTSRRPSISSLSRERRSSSEITHLLGNGFSTLTSTVVTMRLVNHLPPDTTARD